MSENQETMTFDVQVCEKLRAAFQDVFLRHPEVKCLSASICWNGPLNDADITHGLWLSPDGPVQQIDGIVGSTFQTLKMLNEQLGRALQLTQFMRADIITLGQEVMAKHGELEKIKTEIAERNTTESCGSKNHGGDVGGTTEASQN